MPIPTLTDREEFPPGSRIPGAEHGTTMSLPCGSFCRSWQEQLFGLGGVPEADAAGHEVADRHSGEEAASQTQWPVPAPCCSSTQPGRWWRSDAITRRQSETRKKCARTSRTSVGPTRLRPGGEDSGQACQSTEVLRRRY